MLPGSSDPLWELGERKIPGQTRWVERFLCFDPSVQAQIFPEITFLFTPAGARGGFGCFDLEFTYFDYVMLFYAYKENEATTAEQSSNEILTYR